jgi:hypothetical protein
MYRKVLEEREGVGGEMVLQLAVVAKFHQESA